MIDIVARGLAAKAVQTSGATSTITGPLSSTPDAIVLFSGSGGNELKDSTHRITELAFKLDMITGDTAIYDTFTGRTITAGAGLGGGGNLSTDITLSHADTSESTDLISTGNTNGEVIQNMSVLLDTYGHITGTSISKTNLDERFVNVTGDTIDGDLTVSGELKGPTISRIINYTGNGVISGFTLSINTDNTKFDLSAGLARSVNGNGLLQDTYFTGATGIAVTDINHNATYVAYDAVNSLIIQQNSPYSVSQRRLYIIIGAVIHSNRTFINVTNNLPDVAIAILSQFNDLLDSLRGFNVSGNEFTPNGANIQINKSAGVLFKRGVGFTTLSSSPHMLSTPELIAPSNIRFRTQTGVETGNLNYIDCGYYDVNGVRTPLTNGYQIMRIALFSSNLIRIQYGQSKYNKISDAERAINTETFIVEQNIAENGLFRCALIVRYNATDLTDITQAKFINLNRFGDISQSVGGVGGTTSLEQAYANSSEPEIITNSTLGAITIKNGSISDSENLIEFQNLTGSTVANINGYGGISATTATFGTSIDNARFGVDGTLTLNGSATVFDDILGQAISLKKVGTRLVDNLIEGTADYETSATLSDYMMTVAQLPHGNKIGSNIYPHIHYFQTTSSLPNFLVQYRWQTNNKIKTTDWINYKCNTAEFTYTTGTTLNQILVGSGIVPPTGSSLSDIIQFKIIRDTANTSGLFAGPDPVNVTVSVTSFDIHIEKDTIGSSLRFTK